MLPASVLTQCHQRLSSASAEAHPGPGAAGTAEPATAPALALGSPSGRWTWATPASWWVGIRGAGGEGWGPLVTGPSNQGLLHGGSGLLAGWRLQVGAAGSGRGRVIQAGKAAGAKAGGPKRGWECVGSGKWPHLESCDETPEPEAMKCACDPRPLPDGETEAQRGRAIPPRAHR